MIQSQKRMTHLLLTSMEVALPQGSDEPDVQFAKVTKCLRDKEGKPIGTAHKIPLLDTQEYEVEFL
jgi:hypothetical protein